MIELFYKNFECSVILDNSNTSQWFPVKSGVRQGCIISPILFLLCIDWIMKNTTADKPRGIQWTLFSQLEDIDFADDLAILSTTPKQLQEKTDRLTAFSQKTGLSINANKTQVMCINPPTPAQITAEGKVLENVQDFTYLGSIVSTDNGAYKDIKARLGKARSTYARLKPIWKSKAYSTKSKLRLYNSLVKSVLLYSSECWRIIQSDTNKLNAFHNGCLRRICGIYWPNVISNADLYKRTNCQSICTEIKRRRLRWVGHVLRMENHRTPKTAIRWTPTGKRKRGRPKTTWRRTVTNELANDISLMGHGTGHGQRPTPLESSS